MKKMIATAVVPWERLRFRDDSVRGEGIVHLFRQSAWNILGYAGVLGRVFTDTIFTGRLGGNAIAAVGMGGLYVTILLILGIGIMQAFVPALAQSRGARHYGQVIRVSHQIMPLAILTASL